MARIDRAKLGREIQLKMGKDNEAEFRTRRFADEVRDYWAHITAPSPGPDHPYSEGGPQGYSESIQVKRNRTRLGLFTFGYKVYTDHRNAVFLEEGTGNDREGTHSTWGPYTPTPAFHPAARTAFHFRGTAP